MKEYFKTIWQCCKYLFLIYTIGFGIGFVYDNFRFIIRAFENFSDLGNVVMFWFAYYALYLILGTIAVIGISLIGFLIYILFGQPK